MGRTKIGFLGRTKIRAPREVCKNGFLYTPPPWKSSSRKAGTAIDRGMRIGRPRLLFQIVPLNSRRYRIRLTRGARDSRWRREWHTGSRPVLLLCGHLLYSPSITTVSSADILANSVQLVLVACAALRERLALRASLTATVVMEARRMQKSTPMVRRTHALQPHPKAVV